MMTIVFNSGNIMPTIKLGKAQEVAIGPKSAQSAAIGKAGQTPNKLVRLSATSACRIVTSGANPTAMASSTYLPANTVEFTEISPGDKIAVIQEAGAGKLSITECAL